MYRFQQISDIIHRRSKQQQQQNADDDAEEEAQSKEAWLLSDSTLAQLMDPQLAAPAVQFLVLEVVQLVLHVSKVLPTCSVAMWSMSMAQEYVLLPLMLTETSAAQLHVVVKICSSEGSQHQMGKAAHFPLFIDSACRVCSNASE